MISLSCACRAAALLVSLALAWPATATIEIAGATQARFEWAPSSGPINMYYVYESRNGGSAQLRIFRLDTNYVVTGQVGDTVVVSVQAVSNSGILSEFSPESEPVKFVGAQAPPPPEPPPPVEPPPPPVDPVPPQLPPAEGAAPTDFDGDGNADLLFKKSTALRIYPIVNGKKGSAIVLPALAANVEVVGNGDYDADGYADLLTQDRVAGVLRVGLAMDGVVTESASFPISPGWSVIASADFDGDGRTDIALRNPAVDVTEIWTMNGTELYHVAELPSAPAGATATGAGDIDGDGASELIWQSQSGLRAWSVEMDGSAQEVFLHAGADSSWNLRGSCDLDRDGRADLLLRSASSGELWALRFPNGTPLLADMVNTGKTTRALIAAGDYDNDGDCDLALQDGSHTPLIALQEGAEVLSNQSLLMLGWTEVGVGEEGP